MERNKTSKYFWTFFCFIGFVDWLLNKAFLNHKFTLLVAAFLVARQCCAEECGPWFTSYLSWFGKTFGSESSWATHTSASQQTFEFFINFLTAIVPYEPPACLRAHINKVKCTETGVTLLPMLTKRHTLNQFSPLHILLSFKLNKLI